MRFKQAEKLKKQWFYGVTLFITWFFERKLFSEIWHVKKCSFQVLTHRKIANLISCFSKKHESCKKCRFHRVTWFKTWLYGRKLFSDSIAFPISYYKNRSFQKVQFKFWCTWRIYFKNMRFGGAVNLQKLSFSCSNLIQNVIFWMQTSFRIPTTFKKVIQKVTQCKEI